MVCIADLRSRARAGDKKAALSVQGLAYIDFIKVAAEVAYSRALLEDVEGMEKQIDVLRDHISHLHSVFDRVREAEAQSAKGEQSQKACKGEKKVKEKPKTESLLSEEERKMVWTIEVGGKTYAPEDVCVYAANHMNGGCGDNLGDMEKAFADLMKAVLEHKARNSRDRTYAITR